MRPRLSEVELATIIDALKLRLEMAREIYFKHRNEINWNRYFRLERTIIFLEQLQRKLEYSLKRYGKASWNTETPITDLVLQKELKDSL
ncbi:MAG: hypothetical protein QXH37_02620 [Candidatus Bathyarchaeia archaeon]